MSIKINPGVRLGPGTSAKVPLEVISLEVRGPVDDTGNRTIIPRNYSKSLTAFATLADSSVVDYTSKVVWSSDNANATVNSNGSVLGVATGSVFIRAEYLSFSATRRIDVMPVTLVFIGITPPTPAVLNNNTLQLTATGTFADGSTLDITNQSTWSSTDELIATVDSNGLVRGQSVGNCIIRSTSYGVQGSVTLLVTSAPGASGPLTGTQHNSTEEEIVNQETILQYYETLSPSDRQALVDALRTDEIAVLARERAERKARNLALGVPSGKTIDEYSTSAWQIKQDYPDSEDGLYWIQNDSINNGDPIQVYCDMTTLGGGWTLLVQNAGQSNDWRWTPERLYLHNGTTPPSHLSTYDTKAPEQNYSILTWADKIKRSESEFDFMITAREHGSLGGAWTANEPYSFVQTLENVDLGDPNLGTPGWRKNITELARWGYNGNTWNYDTESMEARMPWVGIGINSGWLTTDGFRGGWWGTLITQDGWDPAPWLSNIEGGPHPGVIWYWVR